MELLVTNNICILFVDDEEEICEKLAMSFELEDFKVLTAYSGKEAIQVLKDNSEINFVISDVKMPNGDGIYLLDYVKKNFAQYLPIVMLSGFSELSEDDLIKRGALGLLPKPTNVDDLIDYVKMNCLKN
jgi:DNA-binding NtrC family response regulator